MDYLERTIKDTDNDCYTLLGVVKENNNWKFCNTKPEPYPNKWSRESRCPKCGNNLVNVLGTCATKVYG